MRIRTLAADLSRPNPCATFPPDGASIRTLGTRGDVPGPGGCESTVFAGDSLVAWIPCPENKTGNDYSISHSQGVGADASCPSSEGDYDFIDFAKETLPWLLPELKGADLLAALSKMKRFSREKQAHVEMAELDKKLGMTADDMQAYRDLNAGLPDPFADDQGPEQLSRGGAHSQTPHGHVGPCTTFQSRRGAEDDAGGSIVERMRDTGPHFRAQLHRAD